MSLDTLDTQMYLALTNTMVDKIKPETWDWLLVSDMVFRTGKSLKEIVEDWEQRKDWLIAYHTYLRTRDRLQRDLENKNSKNI